jgi:hypothetical protein
VELFKVYRSGFEKPNPKTLKKQIRAVSGKGRWRPATTWWKGSQQSCLWRDKPPKMRKGLQRGGCCLRRGKKGRGQRKWGEGGRGGGFSSSAQGIPKGKEGFWFVLKITCSF